MGRRSATETITALLLAFARERTWRQAHLARELGVTTATLRARLDELTTAGVRLERSEDHPHVYWSVPKGWLPGAVALSAQQAESLMRLLARHAPSPDRDALLEHIIQSLPRNARSGSSPPIRSGESSSAQVIVPARAGVEPLLPVVEDTISAGKVLHTQYFTASRGVLEWRDVSPARLLIGPPARLVALCHRSNKLKWFRVDNMIAGRLAPDVPFRPVAAAAVDDFVANSLEGFHGTESVVDCCFRVRNPDARWVGANLPLGASAEPSDEGIVVHARTAAVLPLARFVVGLGDAVRVETPVLAELVQHLAMAALRGTRALAKPPVVRRRRKAG